VSPSGDQAGTSAKTVVANRARLVTRAAAAPFLRLRRRARSLASSMTGLGCNVDSLPVELVLLAP
jgi:hypothetical protein